MSPTRRRKLLVAARGYYSYAAGFGPTLWYRLNEVSGNALNSGSLGASFDGVPTAVTQAQAGKLGASSAVLFDGANSKITVPAGAHNNCTSLTYALLFRPTSAGEANIGTFYEVGTAQALAARFASALTALAFYRTTAGVTGTTSGLGANTWAWLFITLDMAGDKCLHAYRGVSNAVSEYGYSSQVAVSSLADLSATALTIGNRSDQSRTFAGLYDEFLLFPQVLTLSQMGQLTRLTGV